MIMHELREMQEGLSSRFRRWRAMLARTTPGPLLVRGAVWAAGIVAMLLAYPMVLMLHWYGLILIGLAILPALAPRSLIVTPVLVIISAGWVISPAMYGEPVTLWRLVALAGSLYLVHTAAALAAQLPYDAIVSAVVLLRWFARAGLVLAGTAILAVYLLVIDAVLQGRSILVATLVGFATAIGVTFLLARQLRRAD